MSRVSKVVICFLPILIILISYIISHRWWSIYSNAISDLGNPEYSIYSSLVLNIGLTIYSFILFTYASKYEYINSVSSKILKHVSILLALVACINESFGIYHYVISVLFFISLACFVLYYIIKRRSILMMILFSICVINIVVYTSCI